MTSRGYDPKTVKVSKSVKRMAAMILDPHLRGTYIRDYVNAMKTQARVSNRKNSDDSGKE